MSLPTDPAALENELQQWKTCDRCPLADSRRQVVLGTGDQQSPLMFVGINPGEEEDKQGIPFVGRAGKLLNLALQGIGIAREDCWITNICACHSPSNRTPHPPEISCCANRLRLEIALTNPLVLVPLGATPLSALGGRPLSITEGHGKIYQGMRSAIYFLPTSLIIFPLLHPAAILRDPSRKQTFFAGFENLLSLLQEQGIV